MPSHNHSRPATVANSTPSSAQENYMINILESRVSVYWMSLSSLCVWGGGGGFRHRGSGEGWACCSLHCLSIAEWSRGKFLSVGLVVGAPGKEWLWSCLMGVIGALVVS